MSSKSKQRYGADGRTDILMFDPRKVVLIRDPSHPRYDDRVTEKLRTSFVYSIMRKGVRVPIEVAYRGTNDKNEPLMELVDGRQRVRGALAGMRVRLMRARHPSWESLSHEEQRALDRAAIDDEFGSLVGYEDEMDAPVPLLKANICPETSDADLIGNSVLYNHQRMSEGVVKRAKKMVNMHANHNYSVEMLAEYFNKSEATIEHHLQLMQCDQAVIGAVDRGLLTLSDAMDLWRLPPEAQRATVDKIKVALEAQEQQHRAAIKALMTHAEPEAVAEVEGGADVAPIATVDGEPVAYLAPGALEGQTTFLEEDGAAAGALPAAPSAAPVSGVKATSKKASAKPLSAEKVKAKKKKLETKAKKAARATTKQVIREALGKRTGGETHLRGVRELKELLRQMEEATERGVAFSEEPPAMEVAEAVIRYVLGEEPNDAMELILSGLDVPKMKAKKAG